MSSTLARYAGFAAISSAALVTTVWSDVLRSTDAQNSGRPLAIIGATLVDVSRFGHSKHDTSDTVIIVRGGRIAAVGKRGRVTIPTDATVMNATGKFVVPGLIDGFGSMRSQGFADAYLYEGVTTVVVNMSPAGRDGEQMVASVDGRPRVFRGVTVGGHSDDGTVPSSASPLSSASTPTLSAATLRRIVDSAVDGGARALFVGLDVSPNQLTTIVSEARRKRVALNGELASTTYPEALRRGIGVLLRSDHYQTVLASEAAWHAYARDPNGRAAGVAYRAACTSTDETPALIAFGTGLAKTRTRLMPVLTIEATADDVGAPNPWSSRSAAFVTAAELDDPVDPYTNARPYLSAHLDRSAFLKACALRRRANDRRLHSLGVVYLAGSGAPSFGIMPGGGLHQELALLQEIGLTPREALASATSSLAATFGWKDIGEVRRGLDADLLVLNSDPRKDVKALSDIDQVVAAGEVVDRAMLRRRAIHSG